MLSCHSCRKPDQIAITSSLEKDRFSGRYTGSLGIRRENQLQLFKSFFLNASLSRSGDVDMLPLLSPNSFRFKDFLHQLSGFKYLTLWVLIYRNVVVLVYVAKNPKPVLNQ